MYGIRIVHVELVPKLWSWFAKEMAFLREELVVVLLASQGQDFSRALEQGPHISPKWTVTGRVKQSSCCATLTSSELLKSMVKVDTFGVNLFAL